MRGYVGKCLNLVLATAIAASVTVPAAASPAKTEILSDSGISTMAIVGRPTLKIDGTTAYCVGKYSSGNRSDAISITVTLKQGAKTIKSWSASGQGSVTISKPCTVEAKKTYSLTLSATVNGVEKPSVTVTATGK